MTETSFRIGGITCNGCVSTLTSIFSSMEGVSDVHVDKESSVVILKGNKSISDFNIDKAIEAYPKYSLLKAKEVLSEEATESFKPLIIVVGFILLLVAFSQLTKGSFNWQESMRLFMGGFFIAFSFFKFLDLNGFAQAYQSYDIIAAKWLGWGYIYPVVELVLGILFLFNLFPFYANVITMVVLGISSVGVIRSVISKKKIKCACLGTGFNLPMTTVTIIEDLSMVVMSAIMLYVM